MEYIIEESRLLFFATDIVVERSRHLLDGSGIAMLVADFLKSKSPALQLNREEVEKILGEFEGHLNWEENKIVIADESIKSLTAKILSLSPQGFEKVASGEVEIYPDKSVWVGEYPLLNLIKYKGKHIDIYIKEREGK